MLQQEQPHPQPYSGVRRLSYFRHDDVSVYRTPAKTHPQDHDLFTTTWEECYTFIDKPQLISCTYGAQIRSSTTLATCPWCFRSRVSVELMSVLECQVDIHITRGLRKISPRDREQRDNLIHCSLRGQHPQFFEDRSVPATAISISLRLHRKMTFRVQRPMDSTTLSRHADQSLHPTWLQACSIHALFTRSLEDEVGALFY